MAESQKSQFFDTLGKRFWIDCVICICLGLFGWQFKRIYHFERFFLEGDPTLSYPKHEETFSTIVAFCMNAFPLALTLAVQRLMRHQGDTSLFSNYFITIYSVIESSLVSFFFTEIFKQYAGRLRPNFFALCGYPFNEATGTYGTFGVVGSFDKCTHEHGLEKGRKSFPSGHSSAAFAFMGLLSLVLYSLLCKHKYWRQQRVGRVLISIAPCFLAFIIAVSRTRDYYHNFDDILAGSLLGMSCSFLFFMINYHKREEKTPPPKVITVDNMLQGYDV